MPSTVTRRPLPALVALVGLLLLTAIVWWRVLHRGSSADGAAKPCPTPTVTATATLPPPAQVTVDVLNSTKRNGIATRARTLLASAGFNTPHAAGNDNPKVHVTGIAEIRYGPAGRSGAQLLSYYLPGAKLVPTSSRTATVVVSLGQRYKGVASQRTVTTELQTHKIALATTSPTPHSTASPSPTASC